MSIFRHGTCLAMFCGLLLFAGGTLAAAEVVSPNAETLWTAQGKSGGGFDARQYNNATAELYATGMLTSLSTQRIFRDTLPSTADYTQTAHRQTVEDYCGPIAGSICQPGSKWVMWDTPFLQFDTMRRNDGYLGHEYQASGFSTGITRLIGEHAAVGLAVGYDAREQKGRDDYFQKLKGDAFHAALYGGANFGSFFFDAYAGFSWASLRSHRVFNFIGTDNDIRGNYNDNILSGGLKASYVWALPRETRITPSIGFDYSRVHTNEIRETGGNNANLLIDSTTYNSIQMPLMIAANKTFSSEFLSFGGPNSLWTPEVRGGWVPQFGKSYADVTASLQNQILFNSKSTDFGNSYGIVGGGLKIQIRDKFIFALDYDYRFADKYSSHMLTGTYGVSF